MSDPPSLTLGHLRGPLRPSTLDGIIADLFSSRAETDERSGRMAALVFHITGPDGLAYEAGCSVVLCPEDDPLTRPAQATAIELAAPLRHQLLDLGLFMQTLDVCSPLLAGASRELAETRRLMHVVLPHGDILLDPAFWGTLFRGWPSDAAAVARASAAPGEVRDRLGTIITPPMPETAHTRLTAAARERETLSAVPSILRGAIPSIPLTVDIAIAGA